jgi:beta-mannosidase
MVSVPGRARIRVHRPYRGDLGKVVEQCVADLQQGRREYDVSENWMRHRGICKLAVAGCFLFLLGDCWSQRSDHAKLKIDLDKNWEFRQSDNKKTDQSAPWLPAQVPGDVHLDLLYNKVVTDPFYRDNEAKLQWIENADWTYKTVFKATPEILNHRNIDLVFQGLDTNATVFINGQKALEADNMFRVWRVDAKPFLRVGANEIRVEFASPIKIAEKLSAEDKTHSETHIPEKSYIRKAAYEYGWDWGPRFVTSGIWQPVYLEIWDQARIEDVQIAQPDVRPEIAHVAAKVTITSAEEFDAELRMNYTCGDKSGAVIQKVHLHAGQNTVDLPVEIVKP